MTRWHAKGLASIYLVTLFWHATFVEVSAIDVVIPLSWWGVIRVELRHRRLRDKRLRFW